MKKTLALVLALVMVLALVPAAFADSGTVQSDSYDLTVEFDVHDNGSVEVDGMVGADTPTFQTKYTKSGKTPEVVVTAPWNAIDKSANSLWVNGTPKMKVTLKTLGGSKDKLFSSTYTTDQEVYVNSKKLDFVTSKTAGKNSFDGETLIFYTDGLSQTNATYSYEVKITGKNGSDTMAETVNFTIAFKNTQKNVYALKFNQPDPYQGVELKDGVYYIDSATGSPADVWHFIVNVAKNDGSSFTEPAYYGISDPDSIYWPTAVADPDKSMIQLSTKLDMNKIWKDPGKAHTYKVAVETEYAIYHGEITIKYRTNVTRVDPKGIDFAKSEYTIGVNEVLTPAFNTVVPVWHNVASFVTLATTNNSEMGIVDVDDAKKTITGLREGTVYVTATYEDKVPGLDNVITKKTYTDTVKVTVKGTYQVTDKANYKVTTKSGNLNVRASASTSAKKIGSLKKGDVVEVVEIKNGWAKIIYPAANYTNGYVSAQYLTKEGTKPETVVGTKTVIARVLNVRSGAGTSYSIVGKLTRNTKVEVIETVASGKWAKIKFNDSYAYVSCTYLQ